MTSFHRPIVNRGGLCIILFITFYNQSALSKKSTSQTAPSWVEYQHHAKQLQLAQDSHWQLLLRLYSDDRSEVQDANFFLSVEDFATDFTVNAEQELDLFLQALFSSSLNELHPLCVFPLRSRWLIEQLSIPSHHFSALKCVQLTQFVESYRQDKIALLFMDERVNTIPNMMGHIGLKLYSSHPSLQDQVISYVTILHTFNPLTMLSHALIGGGEGRLGLYDFEEILAHYLQGEQRSIFEYELKMDENQIETLLLQLWEVKNRKSRYTYLSYNCVTPLFDLMRAADENLEDKFTPQKSIKYWYSPLEYIQFLQDTDYLKNAQSPQIYWSKEDKERSIGQTTDILTKAKTSRLALGYENGLKGNQKNAVRMSFDLHGSLLSDYHRTDFTEYELRILSLDGRFYSSNNSLMVEEVNAYAVKYLPSFQLNLASLSWQAKIGGKRFSEDYQEYNKQGLTTDFFSPRVLSGVGIAKRMSESIFLWGLLHTQYVHRQTQKGEFIVSSELGMMVDVDLFGNQFKSTLYYWDYFSDVKWVFPRLQWLLNWRINKDYEANFSALVRGGGRQSMSNSLFDNVLGSASLSYYF